MIYIGLLFLVILVVLLRYYPLGSRKLPPGPQGLPLLGSLLSFVASKPHLKFSEWAERFGRWYIVFVLHKPVMVVNDVKLQRQFFGLMASSKRFQTELFLSINGGAYGPATEGDIWIEQKQFFMKTLRQFGFGRGSSLESGIIHEVEQFSRWMANEQRQNGNVMMHKRLKQSTTAMLWTLLTGEKLQDHESEIVYLLDNFIDQLQVVTKTGLILFPAMKHVAPKLSGYTDFKSMLDNLHGFLEKFLLEQQKTRNPEEPTRHVMGAYLEKMANCQDPLSSFYGEEGWKHSFANIVSLFLGGGESTATEVNWTIFYLVANQKAQESAQREIDAVIGKDREPSFSDIPNMPYMEAVILEALRYSSFVPMGVMHELGKDIHFEGYDLPKGLLLIPNIYYMHNDKKVWGDPENFRPERFLGNGSDLKECVASFQPGKRSCPGEKHAKDMMFLVVILCTLFAYIIV